MTKQRDDLISALDAMVDHYEKYRGGNKHLLFITKKQHEILCCGDNEKQFDKYKGYKIKVIS